ncbi:MAG: hypothetical protein Q8891_16680 [Bacteroidota bacterium]|nr:hypothetical protein [Bacteroidota bacterium]
MPISNFSIADKTRNLTRLTCFFWLIAKIISYKVWLADRLFPLVPPFNFLEVPSAIHTILFSLSLLILVVLLLLPTNKILLVSIIVIEILSCALDQNRWQPWEYQYILLILILIINYKNKKNAVSVISLLLISVYFYSGVSKLNPIFSRFIRHEIVHANIFHESTSMASIWVTFHLGYLLTLIEILLSIGLLFRQSRKIAASFLIAMHLLILAAFGPFGLNYDKIIWPWNIVMMGFLYLLFIHNSPVTPFSQSIKQGWNKLILVLFGMLPALNFIGYWDFYLSSSLISGRTPEMYICINHEGSGKKLQPFFSKEKYQFRCDRNSYLLDITAWSFQEMQVPVYPELRIYQSIKKQLTERYPDMKATFLIYHYINGRKERIELNQK